MSAKSSDLARIQETYDLVMLTRGQIEELSITKEQFLDPRNSDDDLRAEGLMNRVFRIAEEAGAISEEVAIQYGFETREIRGLRNILAHAYGEVDREIIWSVIENDFDKLLEACRTYCDDNGLDLTTAN